LFSSATDAADRDVGQDCAMGIRSRLRALVADIKLRRLSKGEAELAYWQSRKRAEGDLSNAHYEWFYTEQFGLAPADYAGKRILDIGCGPRGSLEWATEASERVGLDPLVGEYRQLGIEQHAMRYVEGGAEHIPFSDGHFDIVTAFNVLDHVDDVDDAISEITRVTSAGGTGLLLVEVNHPPTRTEPHTLGWDVLDRFRGWEVVRSQRMAIEASNVYGAARRAEKWTSGPGLLAARLKRIAA
jgi:SAM-dependent methyltransferase